MGNRINDLFAKKSAGIVSVYYTAGFPTLDDTVTIAGLLEKSGVDMVEIGIPFSDSLVDGPTIQGSNQLALQNGMTLKLLFDQLAELRARVSIPVVLMGCINPILQFGIENFCQQCSAVGVDGVIIPDLPPEAYQQEYRVTFDQYSISNNFLITSRTPIERVRYLDTLSSGFIYIVSSEGTTGSSLQINPEKLDYFQTIEQLGLRNPLMVGFGITDAESFKDATRSASGGIIGSAFIRALTKTGSLQERIENFITPIVRS